MTKCLLANFWFMLAWSISTKCLRSFFRNIRPCLHARILWRNAVLCLHVLHVSWFDSLFMLNPDEMPWQLIYISLSTCCITWRNIYLSFEKMPLQMIYLFQFLTFVDMLRFWTVLACYVKVCLSFAEMSLQTIYIFRNFWLRSISRFLFTRSSPDEMP